MRFSLNALQLNIRLALLIITELCLTALLLRPEKEALAQALSSIKKEYKSQPLRLLLPFDQSKSMEEGETPRRIYINHSLINKPPRRLESGRIRRLQAAVLRSTLFSLYNLKPTARELKTLSTIESLPWICMSLQRAAGIGAADELTRDKLYRIQFVFKAFTEGLALNHPAGPGKIPRKRKIRSLFPSSLKKVLHSHKKEQRDNQRSSRNMGNTVRYQALSFHLFLEMQNLILSSDPEKSSRQKRMNHLLRRLH
ncbi:MULTISPECIES: hypothetical protein [unclassified Oceanispirochaeta]|uniref:hypothetical protein n=1 Tax=unclassified Oceanispirochaeta TaxID=2635722 RepID=UPI000E09A004|nr:MULTISPECIES: hypothetical protein [unclassified Oceanispirochaeta]MBF9018478.1 hypothetical protein [Oceanispirochaeta sp. M2]NPD74884.1 hypothetical protein [Oceanispirochaeta sp. M1]RDG29271.1 hypothetical protein DV872_22565 [Oceanispirochaeta sp. M1]